MKKYNKNITIFGKNLSNNIYIILEKEFIHTYIKLIFILCRNILKNRNGETVEQMKIMNPNILISFPSIGPVDQKMP